MVVGQTPVRRLEATDEKDDADAFPRLPEGVRWRASTHEDIATAAVQHEARARKISY